MTKSSLYSPGKTTGLKNSIHFPACIGLKMKYHFGVLHLYYQEYHYHYACYTEDRTSLPQQQGPNSLLWYKVC